MVSHNSPCPGLILGWLKTKQKQSIQILTNRFNLKDFGDKPPSRWCYIIVHVLGLLKPRVLLGWLRTKQSKTKLVYLKGTSFYALIISKQCHEGRKRHLWRPHFSKGLTKLAILPSYKCPGLICLALPARQRFGLILVINFFLLKL